MVCVQGGWGACGGGDREALPSSRSYSGPEQGLHHRHGSPETAESVSGSWVS